MNKIQPFMQQQADAYNYAAWPSPSKKARLLGQEAKPASSSSCASLANTEPIQEVMVKPWDVAAENRTSPGGGRRRAWAADAAGTMRIENTWKVFSTVNPYHDAHLWRKYGEKNISGLASTRCYYRCTYSPCPAKKRVEQQSKTDPHLFLISYQGEHTCQAAPVSAQQHMPPLLPPLPLHPPPAAAAAAAVVAAAEQFLLKVESEAHEIGEEQRRSPSSSPPPPPPPPSPCHEAEGSCGDPPAADAAPIISDACAGNEVANPAAASGVAAPGDGDDDPWGGLSWPELDVDYLMEMDSWDYELAEISDWSWTWDL